MFWRKFNLKAVGQQFERSDVGLQYKVFSKERFDNAAAIYQGEKLLDHVLRILKISYQKYPKAQDIPVQLDYYLGVLAR